MSHNYPGPNQPQQPYPGPYTGGPAPYQPPPPPKKGLSNWAIAGITVGGAFAFLILMGALISSGDDSGSTASKPNTVAQAPKDTAKTDTKPADKKEQPAKAKPAPEAPVKVTAKNTTFKPSVLHDGGAYTSIQVTITNNSDETISSNPLNFTITDTDGTKHASELAVDKNQIDTLDIEPGENITGVITGKGDFTAKYVTYTDGWFGEGVRGNVS